MANISGFGNGIVASGGITPGSTITGPLSFNGAITFNNGLVVNQGADFRAANLRVLGFDSTGSPGNANAGGNTGGKSAFSSATAAVTITAGDCATTSAVFVVLLTNDATAILKNCVPGAGSFTVNLTANCTGNTNFGWMIWNA